MINWLLEQQLVFSLLLLFMITIETKGIHKLGSTTVYALWILVPLGLIANSLPQDVITVSDTSIYRHIVNLDTATVDQTFNISWAWLWALGCSVILYIAGLSQLKIHQLPRNPTQIHDKYRSLPNKLPVYTSSKLSGPILSGVFKPELLLPQEFHSQFSVRQQQLMLAHELVHYQRKDNLYNLLALILVVLFWFNPLSWLAYRAFRRSQELACDATVLKNLAQKDKITYSKALVKCAEHSLHSFSIYSPYGEKSSMQKRIKNIQNNRSVKPAMIGLALALSTSLIAGVALANMAETSHKVKQAFMATPVIRIEPKYPEQAAQNGTEGSVILQFDISKDGSTDNIEVVESFPQQIFDKESVAALEQWTYKPRIQGGKAQIQTGLQVQLDFRLAPNKHEQSASTSKIEKIKVQH